MIAAGFADPVIDGQAAFRALMDATARPGTLERLPRLPSPPLPLSPGLAALALTLADHETTLWLSGSLSASADVAAYIRFETGARLVGDPSAAAFALAGGFDELPPLAAFAAGSDDYPDRSTTVLVGVAALGRLLALEGPGIKGRQHLAVEPWPERLFAERAENRALFPRGTDLVLVSGGAIAALPRTTAISEG